MKNIQHGADIDPELRSRLQSNIWEIYKLGIKKAAFSSSKLNEVNALRKLLELPERTEWKKGQYDQQIIFRMLQLDYNFDNNEQGLRSVNNNNIKMFLEGLIEGERPAIDVHDNLGLIISPPQDSLTKKPTNLINKRPQSTSDTKFLAKKRHNQDLVKDNREALDRILELNMLGWNKKIEFRPKPLKNLIEIYKMFKTSALEDEQTSEITYNEERGVYDLELPFSGKIGFSDF
jgi:hypothetical protein